MELTSNPNKEKLIETEVKGRKVYVSEKSETAYVETNHGLVSMTNLHAWNHLIEEAKKKEIDGYDEAKTVDEKQVERIKKSVADKIRELRTELADEEARLRP